MELIFNKSNKGATELRDVTSSFFASNNFDRIKTKVLLAQESVQTIIGEPVMSKAVVHYLSDKYQAVTQTEAEKLLTNLVEHIQMPVGYLATLEYHKANELTHDDTGRKMKIDGTTERTPWQWQIDRDDDLSLRMYYKTTDRLIAFLEANADSIAEWRDGAARTQANALFVRNAAEFNQSFPIDNSGAFYYAVLPFIKQVEREYINKALGDVADAIKAARLAGNLTETQDTMLSAVMVCVPLLTMSIAVKRLSIKTLPDAVVQNYFSNSMDRNASQPAAIEHIKQVSNLLMADGLKALDEVKKLVANTEETDPVVTDFYVQNDTTNKFFRT